MRGYKILGNDLTCGGAHFALGATKRYEGEGAGFVFCPVALDCLVTGKLDRNHRYVEVEAKACTEEPHGRCTAKELEVLRELTFGEFASLCNGTVVRRHSGGTPWIQTLYDQGKAHGVRTTWWENGLMQGEETWVHGVMQGRSTTWYESGAVESLTNFVNGQFDGICRTFTLTGAPLSVSRWCRGRMVAIRRCYPDGKLPRPTSPVLFEALAVALPASPAPSPSLARALTVALPASPVTSWADRVRR